MADTIQVPDGRLFLGGSPDKGVEEPLFLKSSNLTTHGVIVGMTGSGKTGLGIVLLEEVLLSGIPALILDPKGDMGNLLLTFPELNGEALRPWISESEAAKDGVSPDEFATNTAAFWKKGLASWQITPERIGKLREKVGFTLYSPGSTAGVPLNIVGSLQAPKEAGNIEPLRDEIEGFVTSLLALVGIKGDPISSREHILLANLIEFAWQKGNDLDLASLVGQIQDPPLRKLGVIDLDSFFPKKDRRALALKINGLLASPSFATWMEGPALDIDSMLYTPDGRPKAAIVTLAHLSDEERQFVVTLILSKLITWMRRQPGSEALRAMVYMDEVFGFVPPTQAPPSKKPILTILKQARAFGLGMVLSTQNPVDIDYKALSNTGTWMIGRLQTERDKARLMDGLNAASGGADIATIEKQISGLGKRQFLLHSTKGKGPQIFGTRWAMSYLRGPMTREEISQLTESAPEREEESVAMAEPASVASSTSSASQVAPEVAKGTPAYYLHPAADWRDVPAFNPTSKTVEAALAVRLRLLYDDERAKIKHTEEWETIVHPLPNPFDADAAIVIDYDDRDLQKEAPDGIQYNLADAPIDTASYFKKAGQMIKDRAYMNRSVTIYKNPVLKLYSRLDETREQFEARCNKAAEDKADEAADKLRTRFKKKIDRTQDMIDKAEDRVEALQEEKSAKKTDELLSGVGSLISIFAGGRGRTRSLATSIRRASSKRKQTRSSSTRLNSATDRLEDKLAELEELEAELADALVAIDDEWTEKAAEIEDVEIGLEKTDISVDQIALVWMPV